MSERRFTLVPPFGPVLFNLVEDLTEEAKTPDPITGRVPTAESIHRWCAGFKENGGWAGVFLDDRSRPVAFVGAAEVGGIKYTSGLITKTLVADKRMFVSAMREWRKRLGPGLWTTVFPAGQAATERMHLFAGFTEAESAHPDYVLMEIDNGY